MGDRNWKLGEDLSEVDSLVDDVTFRDLILAVHCNCQKITPDAVRTELNRIINQRLEDTFFLVENNMEQIIKEARKGRE